MNRLNSQINFNYETNLSEKFPNDGYPKDRLSYRVMSEHPMTLAVYMTIIATVSAVLIALGVTAFTE